MWLFYSQLIHVPLKWLVTMKVQGIVRIIFPLLMFVPIEIWEQHLRLLPQLMSRLSYKFLRIPPVEAFYVVSFAFVWIINNISPWWCRKVCPNEILFGGGVYVMENLIKALWIRVIYPWMIFKIFTWHSLSNVVWQVSFWLGQSPVLRSIIQLSSVLFI